MRGNRAAEAPEDIENPDTLEDRVRKAGRHFLIEYGLFTFTAIHTLLATEEDPTFSEDTEFESEKSCIQGQLRDIVALLPADARAIHDQEWIASAVRRIPLCFFPIRCLIFSISTVWRWHEQ